MRRFLLNALLFCLPVVIIIIIGLFLPTKFDNHYLYASNQKKSLLKDTDKPRIVFLGGSNLAFGLNSQLIRDSLQISPINMGLHAGIGLKYILESSYDLLREDDIVVISPEYEQFANNLRYGEADLLNVVFDVETASFSETTKLRFHNLKLLNLRQYISLARATMPHVVLNYNKLYKKKKKFMVPDNSFYKASGFNEFGDYTYHWVDTVSHIASIPTVEGTLEEVDYDSFQLLSAFKKKCRSKNIQLYIAYPCIYDKVFDHSIDFIEEVDTAIKQLEIPILGTPESYKFASDYLYDTRYHLTKEGADSRTNLLIKDLKEDIR